MTCDIALKIVAHELRRAETSGKESFHVTFMGGEPFLNFDVIRCVIEWMQSQNTCIKMEASITTNGVLVTDEIKNWLVAHRDVLKVQLSYDGTMEQQQTNRTNKTIDVDFFIKTFQMQGVHITISRRTLPHLSNGVEYILTKGARCSTTLALGTHWSEQDAHVYLRELRLLANMYLTQYSDREPIPTLFKTLEHIGNRIVDTPSCRECIDFLAYDVDGTVYPCHLFMPLIVGDQRVISMAAFEQDEELRRYGGKNDPYCFGCPLVNWCHTCYGFNYLYTGCTGTRNHNQCKMMFAQAFAASEFQIRHFMKIGVSHDNAHKVQAAIRAYRLLRVTTKSIE